MADKKKYSFNATANSTGAVTINGIAFKKLDGTLIGSGGVKTNKVYDFYYDSGANSVFILAKAEGDAVVGDVLAAFTLADGTTGNSQYLEITGLDFTPSVITIKGFSSPWGIVSHYIAQFGALYPKEVVSDQYNSSTISKTSFNYKADVLPAYVNGTGFKLPINNAVTALTVYWTAIE